MDYAERNGDVGAPDMSDKKHLHLKQEETVRTEYGETERFGIGKGIRQGVHSLPLVVQSVS